MMQIKLYHSLWSAAGRMVLDLDMEIHPGELLAVYGPSGSGKTTLLRMLAGLARPERGYIRFGEEVWLDTAKRTIIPTKRRKVGLVFQEYALFPNMTVRKNLEYALDRGQSKSDVEELMHIMELEELAGRYPAKLSGGQQQRVALARALVRRPHLLLLDEPLSALDTEMRIRLQEYILQVHNTYSLTTVLVSHDVHEVIRLADRVILLEEGKIQEVGGAAQVLSLPGWVRLEGMVSRIVPGIGAGFAAVVVVGSAEFRIGLSAEMAQNLKEGDMVQVALQPSGQPVLLRE
ncbi:MAG: ATP-binding cassette domain-containing protein [Saprospirales bacterium]|nr:ATP-binding cassette domain-containing protein [Saprospirales bacterium]